MKTFLLGVGCQKGGTTWLHRYLNNHANCDLGFRKEYHVFDALFVKNAKMSKFYVKALKDVADLAIKRAGSPNGKRAILNQKLEHAALLTSFYQNPEHYADYFSRLYDRLPGVDVVGDITPSYNALKAKDFTYIRDLLERRGFRVKVVFLMRDPVERIYSATRMRIRDQVGKPEIPAKEPLAFLNRRYAWSDVEARTRYENTIAALDESFTPEDVLYGFYETLFNAQEVRRITDFLGLPYEDPDFGARINVSPKTADLDADSIATVRAYYDETYQVCQDRFGKDLIKDIWPHA